MPVVSRQDGTISVCGGCTLRQRMPQLELELPSKRSRRGKQELNSPPPDHSADAAVAGLAEAIASLAYTISQVPSCFVTPDGIPGSVVYPVLQRSQWEAQTSELLALCHEAAERRANKTGAFRGIHHDHAEAERMSLAFIQDRIDTDDPMRGYTVRTDDAQVPQKSPTESKRARLKAKEPR